MEKIFSDLIKEIEELNELDNKSIAEIALKFNEEFGEFSAELCKVIGISHKPYDRDHLLEEAADSLQCHLSVILRTCKSLNIEFIDILKTMSIKNEKWRSKIPLYTKPII